MSLDEESVVLEERRKERGEMLGRCFHGEIQTWSRHVFYAFLIYEQKKNGAIRNYREETGQIQRAKLRELGRVKGAAGGVGKQEDSRKTNGTPCV